MVRRKGDSGLTSLKSLDVFTCPLAHQLISVEKLIVNNKHPQTQDLHLAPEHFLSKA